MEYVRGIKVLERAAVGGQCAWYFRATTRLARTVLKGRSSKVGFVGIEIVARGLSPSARLIVHGKALMRRVGKVSQPDFHSVGDHSFASCDGIESGSE